jgi:hypothetical protein
MLRRRNPIQETANRREDVLAALATDHQVPVKGHRRQQLVLGAQPLQEHTTAIGIDKRVVVALQE